MGQPFTSPVAMSVARSSVGWDRRSSVRASKYVWNWAMVSVSSAIGSLRSPRYSGSAAPKIPWVSFSMVGSSS